MEQSVYKGLLKLHKTGEGDPQFQDFIEGEYLEEQVKAINEISKYIAELERIGEDGAGQWLFNKEFDNKD